MQLTFALTFSNDAGLISEKHIKKTSYRERKMIDNLNSLYRASCLLSVGRRGVVVYHNLLDLTIKQLNKTELYHYNRKYVAINSIKEL